MKFRLLVATILITSITYAQDSSPQKVIDANATANTFQLQTIAAQGVGAGGVLGSGTFYNPKFDKEGSVHLFNDWNNRATIYAKNSDGYFTTSNINFNIQRNMFEQKNRDTIRGYNFANIERIRVNGRVFKSYYFEPLKRQKVFEVIYEGDQFSILKGYTVDILDANPNPMVGRLRDKIIQREDYFIDTPKSIKEFKFKKKNILKVLGEKAPIAEDYARKYGMSFGNEDDIKKILSYVQRQSTK